VNGLVLYSLYPNISIEQLNSDQHAAGIRELGILLNEFFKYRSIVGLEKVFHDYARWLLRKKWYSGPLREKTKNKEQNG
jgi:hypothetical protein